MRQIKFRAWDNVKNKMYYVGEEPDICFSFNSSGIEAVDISEEPEFKDLHHLIYMQYTGLKDENGTEIYEGDILEVYPYQDEFYKVKVYQEYSALIIDTPFSSEHDWTTLGYYKLHFGEHTIKTTGNIYENPELLEV